MKKTILAIAVTAIALTATTTFAADANSFNNAVSARDTALAQVQSADSNQAKAANALTAATRTANAATNAYTANPTDANYNAHVAATQTIQNKQLQQTRAMQSYADAITSAKAANAAVTGGALRGQVSAQQAAMPTAPANPTYNVPTAQPMKTPAQPVQSAPGYTAPTAKTPTISPAPSITGTSYRSYVVTTQAAALANPKAATPNGTIQKSVTAVPGNTQVTATVNGKTYTTTAAEVAKYDPTAQVSVPFHSAFNAPARNNRSHDGSNGSRNHSDGRGAENAHSHAFGGKGYGHDNSRTEGFGGHSHFH